MPIRHLPTSLLPANGSFFDDLFDFSSPFPRYQTRGWRRPINWSTGSSSWPSLGAQNGLEEGRFCISLDVSSYSPDDVFIQVEDDKLVVRGRYDRRGQSGFEFSEFQRCYQLPENIDKTSLTSNFTPDGILQVEAIKKRSLGSTDSLVGDLKATSDSYTVHMNTDEYKPEDITVKVNGRQLRIIGKQSTESNGEQGANTKHREFQRSFTIPRDGNVEDIQSKIQADGTLVITVPRDKSLSVQEKVIPIEVEGERRSGEGTIQY